jgi:hypothetical protein
VDIAEGSCVSGSGVNVWDRGVKDPRPEIADREPLVSKEKHVAKLSFDLQALLESRWERSIADGRGCKEV